MKRTALILLALLVVIICSACGDVIVEPIWVIGVKGANKTKFSSIDYSKLEEASFENENGTWRGVYVKDVLEYLGVSEYASVTFTDSEATTKNCPRDAIDAASVILVTERDGKRLRDKGGVYCAGVVIADDAEMNTVKRITIDQCPPSL